MKLATMPRTVFALAALSAASLFLSGCVYVNWDRGGHYRRGPPDYHGDGYHRSGSYRGW